MKNKSIIIIVVAALVLVMGYYVSTSLIGSKEIKQGEKVEDKDGTDSVTTTAEAVDDQGQMETGTKVERELPLDISEEKIQNSIHAMSHAKVYAKQKWSHLEPTQERIDRLLVILEQNKDELDFDDLYISILKNWQAGDYSDAVSDHNEIWKLQDGTVGKATRLLSEKEQAEYRKKHFE